MQMTVGVAGVSSISDPELWMFSTSRGRPLNLVSVQHFWAAKMAFFEQASVLASSWANIEELKMKGAKCSLCVVKGKKLKRRHLPACMFLLWNCALFC